MRLSKKIAAVALAAVMTVSMMTACGSTGGPSSSGSSGAGSNSSSNSNSDSNSSSDSSSNSSSNSNSNSASNGDSEGKNETIAYEKSRTAKFYQKLGAGNYTMNETVQVEANVQGTNIKATIDALASTDGKRAYVKQTSRMEGIEEQTRIILVDLTTKDGWELENYQEPKDGKLGDYKVKTIRGELQGIVTPVDPVKGQEFKQETKGNYYIETQTVEDLNEKEVYSFVYEGNSSMPKYAEHKKYVDGTETAMTRVEYSNFKNQAEEKYLDFDSILANYNKG